MRVAVPDFVLANPIYRNAALTAYTVANGVKTSILATLYQDPVGSDTVSNPHKLDSKGKFRSPIYIEDAVIISVDGISVPGHDTGVIAAPILTYADDVVNARRFGMSPNSSPNVNAAALQAAINSFDASGRGGAIYIPAGTYYVAMDAIVFAGSQRNITVFGDGSAMAYETGYGGTQLVFQGAGIAISINPLSVAGGYTFLKNLAIWGNGQGAIGVKGNCMFHVDRCDISGFTDTGLWLCSGINSNRISNTSVLNNTNYGLRVGDGPGSNTIFSVDHLVSRGNGVGIRIQRGLHYSFKDCTVEGNNGLGLQVFKSTGLENGYGEYINCWFEANSYGGTGYQVSFESQTHTYAESCQYHYFSNCQFNAIAASKCIEIKDGAWINFKHCQGAGAIDLGVNSQYCSFYNQNGGTITDLGIKNYTGHDGSDAGQIGGPFYSPGINAIDVHVGDYNIGRFDTPAFSAGNFTTNGAGGWTVGSGDVTTYEYDIIRDKMTLNFSLVTTSVIAAAGTQLRIAIPQGKVATKSFRVPIRVNDNGGGGAVGCAEITAGLAYIACYVNQTLGTNWTASANATDVEGSLTFEIT